MDKYIALNDKIIIKPLDVKTTLGNGMVIQETRGKKDILVGEVVIPPAGISAILRKESGIKKGDQIWYPEYAALPIKLDGESYLVIDYSDIILMKEGTHEDTEN